MHSGVANVYCHAIPALILTGLWDTLSTHCPKIVHFHNLAARSSLVRKKKRIHDKPSCRKENLKT